MRSETSKVVAVASGKGGVGKTLLSACLATIMNEDKRYREKTLLVDMDFGVKGLTFLVGSADYWEQHSGSMIDVLSGTDPDSVLQSAKDVNGIKFVPSDVDFTRQIDWDRYFQSYTKTKTNIEKFVEAALNTGFEFVIFDTGAGIDRTLLALASHVDQIVVVVEPDEISRTAALDLRGELAKVAKNLYFVMNKMPEGSGSGRTESKQITYLPPLPFDHRMHVRFVRNARSVLTHKFGRTRFKRYVERIARRLYNVKGGGPNLWDYISERTATKVVQRFFGYGIIFVIFLVVLLAILLAYL